MKKEIVKRLIEAGHINFDESLILMETEKEYIWKYLYTYNPLQSLPPFPVIPPYTITCENPNPITFIASN